MAMATALAASSLNVPCVRSTQALGSGIQGVQTPRHSARLTYLSPISVKLSIPAVAQEQVTIGGNALAAALFAAMASSNSALAAQQVMELAADDSRELAILLPLIPAVAWVLYNILQPALNQINRMRSAKGLAIALGMGAAASFLATPDASAVQEVANNDSRGFVLLAVLVPAIAWVLFNILQPALNQINRMRSAKGLIGALGIGTASLLFSPYADATAQEIASIAVDNDSRGLLLLGVLFPAIGWVLFNILQPGLNQINRMKSVKGVAATVGLGATAASFLSVQDAEAVQEVSQLAADADNRPLILLIVLVPAIGWVLFNILQPALNQINRMRSGK